MYELNKQNNLSGSPIDQTVGFEKSGNLLNAR